LLKRQAGKCRHCGYYFKAQYGFQGVEKNTPA
jgi:hypothetical protein